LLKKISAAVTAHLRQNGGAETGRRFIKRKIVSAVTLTKAVHHVNVVSRRSSGATQSRLNASSRRPSAKCQRVNDSPCVRSRNRFPSRV